SNHLAFGLRHLQFCESANVLRSRSDGGSKLRAQTFFSGLHFARTHRDRLPVKPVELARVFEQRLVTPLPYRFENRLYRILSAGESRGLAGQQSSYFTR